MPLSTGPLTPAWVMGADIERRFLATQGPLSEGTGDLSAHGLVRPMLLSYSPAPLDQAL